VPVDKIVDKKAIDLTS